MATLRLNYPQDGRERRAVRDVAARYRPDHRSRAQRERRILELRLRLPAQPGRPGRQSGRPGAAARREPAYTPAPDRGLREIPVGPEPRHDLSQSRQGQDQRTSVANDHASVPSSGRGGRRPGARPRRAHRTGTAGVGAGFLRDGRDRGGRAGRRRGPPARQGASQDPDGRHRGRHRGLSRIADAERHRHRERGPRRRHSGRSRFARRGLRRRHAGDRDRPRQRRGALSRAGAARGQRLSHRADRHHRRRALGVRPVLGSRRQGGRAHHRDRRRQGRGRRVHRRPQRRLRGGAGARSSIPWWSISTWASEPPGSTSTRIRRRASPTRCSRRIASTTPSSTGCCRNAPTI